MSSYTAPLKYERVGLDAVNLYEITESFRFYWRSDRTGEFVRVPKHRITDFGSLPHVAQKLFGWTPTDSDMLKAYLVHDELVMCSNSRRIFKDHGRITMRACGWNEATLWFLRAAKVSGAPAHKRYSQAAALTLYGAVRPFFKLKKRLTSS